VAQDEDEDLQVFGGIAAGEQHERLDGSPQRQVGKFRQHPEASDVRYGPHTIEPGLTRTDS